MRGLKSGVRRIAGHDEELEGAFVRCVSVCIVRELENLGGKQKCSGS